MKIKAIAATTYVDLHNMKMSKEVLESMVEQVNNKEQAISVGIEHDLMVAPIGKIISAKLISIGDGEFAVETEQEIFDTLGVKTINGQNFLVSGSLEDKRPFVNRNDTQDLLSISVDPMNLGGYSEFETYRSDVIKDGVTIDINTHIRKSFIPDPEVIIYLGNLIVGSAFIKAIAKSVGEELAKKISQDLVGLYDSLKIFSKKYATACLPKGKEILYMFVLQDVFVVEMIMINPNPTDFEIHLAEAKIIDCIFRACNINKQISLNKIQFLLQGNEWVVHFICDSNGLVMTSNKAYERQKARISQLNKPIQP